MRNRERRKYCGTSWIRAKSRENSCFCEYVDPKTANWVLTFCGHESLKSPRDSLEKNVMEIVFKIKIKIFCVRKSVIIYEHIFMCSDICVHIWTHLFMIGFWTQFCLMELSSRDDSNNIVISTIPVPVLIRPHISYNKNINSNTGRHSNRDGLF